MFSLPPGYDIRTVFSLLVKTPSMLSKQLFSASTSMFAKNCFHEKALLYISSVSFGIVIL